MGTEQSEDPFQLEEAKSTIDALTQFILAVSATPETPVAAQPPPTPLSLEEVLPNVTDYEELRRLLLCVNPELFDGRGTLTPRDSDNQGQKLANVVERWNQATACKYNAFLGQDVQNRLREHANPAETLNLEMRLRLGQALVLYAVESPRASDMIEIIMTTLSPEAQLAIQVMIERFTGYRGDSDVLPEGSDDDGDNAESPRREQGSGGLRAAATTIGGCGTESLAGDFQDAREPGRPRSRSPVPPLALTFLRTRKTPAAQRGSRVSKMTQDQKGSAEIERHPSSDSHRRSRCDFRSSSSTFSMSKSLDHQDITENLPEQQEEQEFWKRKYESLKQAHEATETTLEEIQIQLEKTRKEAQELQQDNEKIRAELKSHTSASQKSVADIVESLEREVSDLRQKLDEVLREKKDQERSLTLRISTLQDENQLLVADASKIPKLEASLEKYKKRVDETLQLRYLNQELEKKLEGYVHRMMEFEEQGANLAALKKALDASKTRAAELESRNIALASRQSDLQNQLAEATASVEEHERQRMIAERKLDVLKTEYDAEVASLKASPTGVDHSVTDTVSLRERIVRLEKENQTLRDAHPEKTTSLATRVAELENQLDDANRMKDQLEKDYKAALAKVTLRDVEDGGSGGNDAFKLKLIEKENELLVQKSVLQASQAEIQMLRAQLNEETNKSVLLEEVTKKRLEAAYEGTMADLKQQLYERENALNFLYLAREEEQSVHRREARLMSVAFHALGFRYFQAKSERDKMFHEHEALLSKVRKRKSTAAVPLQRRDSASSCQDS